MIKDVMESGAMTSMIAATWAYLTVYHFRYHNKGNAILLHQCLILQYMACSCSRQCKKLKNETAHEVLAYFEYSLHNHSVQSLCGFISSLEIDIKYTIYNIRNCIIVCFSTNLPTNRRISSFLDNPHLPSFACDSKSYSTFGRWFL